MSDEVLELQSIGSDRVAECGGKGANLGELSQIDGVSVPPGFVVTTRAFRRVVGPALVDADPVALREIVCAIAIPEDLAAAIGRFVGSDGRWAVRSSATAEDSASASFAGQHDTFLNVTGLPGVLAAIRRCWASLFTERAVSYRLRSGFGSVEMAVVVQQMVPAEAAGVMFTADPVSGNRKVVSVEAVPGLGESFVAGTASGEMWTVRDGTVLVSPSDPLLTRAQVVGLAEIGRRIEAWFGCPQDIEWCLADGEVWVVQSRPITTLFPIPDAGDDGNHVYISVGHQQMMTDAIRPLGLSFWQMTTPRPMAEAGSRLFVDVTPVLASPTARAGLLILLGRADPLIADALQTVVDRGDFIPESSDVTPLPAAARPTVEVEPDAVPELVAATDASVAATARAIRGLVGVELIDFIRVDLEEMRRILFDRRSLAAIMAGMRAAWWLNEHLQEWLGECSAADALTQFVPGDVTADMGLALLDLADMIRPLPEVVAFLDRFTSLDHLARVPGGAQAREAIEAYLDRYGMRCAGEIDITRPRWRERPDLLMPSLLAAVRSASPGEAARRVAEGRRAASERAAELLARLRELPDGESKADESERMISRLREFTGYREFPKYGFICRYFIYKRALLEEASRLVEAGVLEDPEDIFFLRFDELEEVVRTGRADRAVIRERREAFRADEALRPPRVLTSEGEAIAGAYRRNAPAGALIGVAVSAGTVEGRARVVRDIGQADLDGGDILVTTHTDPSWTPVFVTVRGLVTEVGGLMTHGAVVAREYGLPAVVGVPDATRLIRDGQRIRVNGTGGYVEIVQPVGTSA